MTCITDSDGFTHRIYWPVAVLVSLTGQEANVNPDVHSMIPQHTSTCKLCSDGLKTQNRVFEPPSVVPQAPTHIYIDCVQTGSNLRVLWTSECSPPTQIYKLCSHWLKPLSVI